MRQIKFRAWDKFQNKYIFVGFHILGEVSCFGGIESTIGETWKERSAKLKYSSSLEAWDDFIFEQYTGIKDRQGKDIYEGDVLEDSNRKHKFNIFRVPGGLAMNIHQDDFKRETPFYSALADNQTVGYIQYYCEVIGNIHEVENIIK